MDLSSSTPLLGPYEAALSGLLVSGQLVLYQTDHSPIRGGDGAGNVEETEHRLVCHCGIRCLSYDVLRRAGERPFPISDHVDQPSTGRLCVGIWLGQAEDFTSETVLVQPGGPCDSLELLKCAGTAGLPDPTEQPPAYILLL